MTYLTKLFKYTYLRMQLRTFSVKRLRCWTGRLQITNWERWGTEQSQCHVIEHSATTRFRGKDCLTAPDSHPTAQDHRHRTPPSKTITPCLQHRTCYLYGTKHTASTMQAHGGVEVQLCTLMSLLDRGKCHLHAPGFFAPWETALNTHWKRGWVCPKLMWAFWQREISVTSTTNLKHCTMETQHTVQYDSVRHTVP